MKAHEKRLRESLKPGCSPYADGYVIDTPAQMDADLSRLLDDKAAIDDALPAVLTHSSCACGTCERLRRAVFALKPKVKR